MAGIESQKQFLTLIRGFASESTQGERRIVDLRKRIDELRSEILEANAELEEVKRVKETTEQELKGFEVELAMNETSIQAQEARINSIQEEVSANRSELEELKNEEGGLRDDFIEKMLKMNAMIRNFQNTVVCAFGGDDCMETSKNENAEVARRSLENKLAQIVSQTTTAEQEYQAEQVVHNEAQQELIQLEQKLGLMDALLKANKELQELTRPKQTSEYEELCASMVNELQNRCLCPSCRRDNVEALGGLLSSQAMGVSFMQEGKL